MVRSFRTRPLVLGGGAGLTCILLGVGFALSAMFLNGDQGIVVFAGAALVWLVSGVFLLLLGMIGEAVVHDQNRQRRLVPLIVWELT
jgi:ABC-type Na+ efflux pump permease subunit